jgi:hypothetical protein
MGDTMPDGAVLVNWYTLGNGCLAGDRRLAGGASHEWTTSTSPLAHWDNAADTATLANGRKVRLLPGRHEPYKPLMERTFAALTAAARRRAP